MKELNIKLTGLTSLLTNNPETRDPIGPYVKKTKKLTSKRNKTDQDHIDLSRIDWEASLYLYNGSIQLPAEIIEKTIVVGAQLNRKGKDITKGLNLKENYIPLRYDGPVIQSIPLRPKDPQDIPMPELDSFYDHYVDRRKTRRNNKLVWVSRAIFHNWSLEFTIDYLENILDEEIILSAIKNAGLYIGICEKNIGHFGRFEIEIL